VEDGPLSAVVFDLDGTLVDTAPDLHAAVNRALADAGAAPLSLAQVTDFVGNGIPALVQRAADAAGLPRARRGALLAAFGRHYARDPATLGRPYPGLVPALGALAGAGHALGICTNKALAPARAILSALDLAPHFAAVIGGDSLPQRKPDPAPLGAAVRALGGGPAVFVGDSEVDAETARRAGLPFVLFTEGYAKRPVAALPHAASFADYAELPQIVGRLLAAGDRVTG
jgi:phosphoglycolate phosphatase